MTLFTWPDDLYVLKGKSGNMFNNYKSPETFNSKTYMSKLDIISSNILYMTHEIDQIKKICIQIVNSSNLQKQVDDYFERDETSPQTEQVTNEPD